MIKRILNFWCLIVMCLSLTLYVLCIVKKKYEPYSFFVAGHVYGSPALNENGIYTPFRECFPILNTNSLLRGGFFTGDIVKEATETSWKNVENNLSKLDLPVFFVAGNHDIVDRHLYESRYGVTNYAFSYNHDLFIVLDSNVDNWCIKNNQLAFLEDAIDSHRNVRNIFIFVHHLIFMDFLPVTPNSYEGMAEGLNYKNQVLPLLEATGKPIFLFAGDVGAFDWGVSTFCKKINNVTYVASGMGGGVDDNFTMIHIKSDKSIDLQFVSIGD